MITIVSVIFIVAAMVVVPIVDGRFKR